MKYFLSMAQNIIPLNKHKEEEKEKWEEGREKKNLAILRISECKLNFFERGVIPLKQ